tara:strand:- start:3135 stop:3314 length:180 start_codon:yes stop_codon:yes gene_type:complete
MAHLVQLFIEENTHEVESFDWSKLDRMLTDGLSDDDNSTNDTDSYDEEMENLRRRLRGV